MNFAEFRPWFDERFSALLQQKIASFAGHSDSTEVFSIASYVAVIAQNGKRFRPFLVYLASGLDQQNAEKHFSLFAAIELVHVFALIHDDIMDKADTRHGVVCAHKKFVAEYGESVAEGIGILLGDILFAWAYECLSQYNALFPSTQQRVAEDFARLISEVTHGQLLDILSPVQSPRTQEQIVQKMTFKTARYSFVQPLRLGFVIKGDDARDQEFAESFGTALGIGFQVQDDLLDTLPVEETGKSRFTDIQTGQQTLLTAYMQKSVYANDFAQYFKRELGAQEIEVLGALLIKSGAVEYVQKVAQDYFDRARTLVDAYRTVDSEVWGSIVTLIQERKK
jgi:geranylgeranyl diphosphate synthase type I